MASSTRSASPDGAEDGGRIGVRLEKRLAAGSLASFVALLLGIGTAIAQVPLLLSAWGEDTYGAWLLVVATNALITSIDLGHQNFVGNRISMLGLHDVAACRKVLGSAVRIACVIGAVEVAATVAAVWSGVFATWVPSAQAGAIGIREQAEICLLLYIVYHAILVSLSGIVVRLYYAGGLYARAQWIGIVHRFVMFLSLVVAAGGGASLLVATAATLGAGALISVWVLNDLRIRFPLLWPWWQEGSLGYGLHQAAMSLGLTATAASDQCAAVGLLGIAGSYTRGHGVATLGTLRTLTNSVLQAAGIFVLPVVPDLSRYAASADRDKAAAALSALWLLSTAPLCAGVSGLAPFAQPVYEWWTRGRLTFSASLFMLLAVGVLVRQWQTPSALFLFSANRLRAQFIVSALRTLTLLGLLAIGFSVSGNILVAGLAVLGSESAGAIAATFCASAFLRDMNGSLPTLSAGLALGQVATTAICGFAWIAGLGSATAIVAVSLVAHLILAMLQWLAQPSEVKQRMKSLLMSRLAAEA